MTLNMVAAELGTARGENARRVTVTLVTGELTCRLTGEKIYRPFAVLAHKVPPASIETGADALGQ